MDNKRYEKLRKINYVDTISEIEEELKKKGHDVEKLSEIISITFLALIGKSHEIDFINRENFLGLNISEVIIDYLLNQYDIYNEVILNISEYSSEDNLIAIILFYGGYNYKQYGENSTPESITKLVSELFRFKKDDILLDMGSGQSTFLQEASQKYELTKIYGVELNTNNVVISELRNYLINSNFEIFQGNAITQDFTQIKANKIFCNMPFGQRFKMLENQVEFNAKLKKYLGSVSKSIFGDWVYSISAYLNCTSNGKTISVISNGGTWNKQDLELRKKLIEDGVIEGIIALPSKLFQNTGIPVSLLILSQGNTSVKMVDATEIFNEGRRQNVLNKENIEQIFNAYFSESEISRDVDIKELVANNYIINPQRYIGIVSVENAVKLGELCKSIIRGATIKRTDLDKLNSNEETETRYLMLKNINDNEIDKELPYLKDIDEKLLKYAVKPGDLILSKNWPLKIALVHKQNKYNTIANGNLYIVKVDESKIHPRYLYVYLQSENAMTQFNKLSKGSAIMNITKSDLESILIPMIVMEEQIKIAELHENYSDELIILERQAELIKDKRARLLEV